MSLNVLQQCLFYHFMHLKIDNEIQSFLALLPGFKAEELHALQRNLFFSFSPINYYDVTSPDVIFFKVPFRHINSTSQL